MTARTLETAEIAQAEEILNTIKYRGFVGGLFNVSGDPSKDFAHAVLGLVTEEAEIRTAVDALNVKWEVGDFLFYYQAALDELAKSVDDSQREAFSAPPKVFASAEEFQGFVEETLKTLKIKMPTGMDLNSDLVLTHPVFGLAPLLRVVLLDVAKRWVGYNKAPPDLRLVADVLGLYRTAVLMEAEDVAGEAVDVDECIVINVVKLLVRYQGLKFSQERALNRDLGAEESAMKAAEAGGSAS